VDFDDIRIGDIVNLKTNIMRRRDLSNCLVVDKVNNPSGGYVGMFLLQGQSRARMYIPWNMVIEVDVVGFKEVL